MNPTPPPIDPRLATAADGPVTPPGTACDRGKTRRVLVLGLGFPLLIVVAIASYSAVNRARNIERVVELRRVQDKLELEKMKLQSKVRNGTATAEDIDRFKAVTDSAADSVGKDDKQTAAAMREFIALTSGVSRPMVNFSQEFQAAGGLDPATLTSKASLEDRAAMLRRADLIVTEAIERTRRLRADTREICTKNGLDDASTEKFLANLSEKKAADLVRIRELDREIFRQGAAYLKILSDNADKWEIADGRIVFQDEKVLLEFQAVTRRMGELGKEQTEVLKTVQGDDRFLSKP